MQRTAVLLVLLLLGGASAVGDDKPPAKAASPQTLEQATGAVLEAVKAGEPTALKALATQDRPDPWIVADELCFQGEQDAAAAFAQAAPRTAVERLPAYVDSRRGRKPDTEAREFLTRIPAALSAGKLKEVAEPPPPLMAPLDSVCRIRIAHARGVTLRRMRRLEESARVLGTAAEAAAVLGWLNRASALHHESGLSAYYRSDWRVALTAWTARIRVAEALGHRVDAVTSLGNVGVLHNRLGDLPKALSCHERSLKIQRKLGDDRGVARTLVNLGNTYLDLGNYPTAISFHRRALGKMKKLGNQGGVAAALGNLGNVYGRLGDYPKALSFAEQALALEQQRGHRAGAAAMLANIGLFHYRLGDFERALTYYNRSISIKEELGDRHGIAGTLMNIGNVHLRLGDLPRALTFQERSLALKEELGDRLGIARTLDNIALIHKERGDYVLALSCQKRSLALKEAAKDRPGIARTLGNIGVVYRRLGDTAKALQYLEHALREAQRLRARPLVAAWLTALAELHLAGGKAERALSRAQQCLDVIEALLGGLGEEEAATARTEHARLFAVGTLAAMRLDDVAEAVRFLESGRAGALLESLGAGRALRFSALPATLLQSEAEARALEARARSEYRQALGAQSLKEMRRKAKLLDEALEGVRGIATRIQREAKREAGLFYPRAATIEEIQGRLEPDQVLVLYGLCLDEALAVVLTRAEARTISLGAALDVTAACDALEARDLDADPTAALARLKKLLVEPLRLGDGVNTVLIAPEGPLCYLPFGALFDKPVACTPSASTHVLLLDEERGKGAGVLALGDPDYAGVSAGAHAIYFRGRQLTPLAATRVEAQAVGDVVLLGAEASEEGLIAKVNARERWRAVHFACHGLVDPERPSLSSLALSGSEHADGFLTCLDVLRMEIPADLAVLSACETGTGRIVKGEGILGLTRAFMYAGAPRVLCSLWKVDDDATRALMIKFYALWNPKSDRGDANGLGTAAALREAQKFVRDQPKWKHPYYWAAWLVWGLAD